MLKSINVSGLKSKNICWLKSISLVVLIASLIVLPFTGCGACKNGAEGGASKENGANQSGVNGGAGNINGGNETDGNINNGNDSGSGGNTVPQVGYLMVNEVQIWIDLMPGGPSGFLFAGSATFAPSEKPELKDIIPLQAIITSGSIVRKFPFKILNEEDLGQGNGGQNPGGTGQSQGGGGQNPGDTGQKPARGNLIAFSFASAERNNTEGLIDIQKASIELMVKYKGEIYKGSSQIVEVKRTH